MVDFASLKKSRTSDLEKINEQIKKANAKEGGGRDDRFWQPSTDKAGNGFAIVRFLPAPGDEPVPFVRTFAHGFKGEKTGLWYIEESLTTLGAGTPDPVSEYNTKLWNSTTDDESPARKQARKQKRKLNYISNVYIVSDPANPDNDGKVFLYKYGKKIFDKLNEAMNPQFADESPMNPFDLWGGANFKIKIREVEGYRNYDKSEFAAAGPLLDDDKELEKIWKSEYSLQAFLDPKNFKDYATLKARLDLVLGFTAAAAQRVQEDTPRSEAASPKAVESRGEPSSSPPWEDTSNDDEYKFFENLANEE